MVGTSASAAIAAHAKPVQPSPSPCPSPPPQTTNRCGLKRPSPEQLRARTAVR
jgi:hypothetical protein